MKKLTMILTLAAIPLLFASSISSCSEKAEESVEKVVEPTFDLATAKSEIVAANKEFMEALAAMDSVGLANLYTQDAKFMMTGAPAYTGRQDIQSALSDIMNSGITGVDLRTVEVWGTEDMVVEEGEYTLFAEDSEADKGKYLVLWKKENGNWKLHRDIFNSNMPAE
ncbi:SgcJ/EcaC family oxidoreductase [Echinicola jeungdonensis]|uniref:YybH family protein n=1 Tax=Echinicola jeungdonensis TaxID=709343 RepID=A0ABV5J0U5_9BACT|nr:SgcJ/EcaC family oxidoreductase [Echinicola jeungdonensis]MDN3667821.1 SgcJ/EcaC family oxidoreductase [Echinicola jeungdonensis]